MRAAVLERRVEVVGPAGLDRPVGLLGVDVRAGEVAVGDARGEVVGGDDDRGVQADPELAPGWSAQWTIASAATSGW